MSSDSERTPAGWRQGLAIVSAGQGVSLPAPESFGLAGLSVSRVLDRSRQVTNGEPVGEEARPVASVLHHGYDDVDLVILVEMVGAGRRHPRIRDRDFEHRIGAIGHVANLHSGNDDLCLVTQIYPIAVLVDRLPPHGEGFPCERRRDASS